MLLGPMPKTVEKSITINASASKVWDVLTNPTIVPEWVRLWWPSIVSVKSDWKVANTIVWKTREGIGAEGEVLAVRRNRMLEYTFDVKGNPKEQTIVYTLEEKPKQTILHISVGSFGESADERVCYQGAVESWEKSLPKIKELAEKL